MIADMPNATSIPALSFEDISERVTCSIKELLKEDAALLVHDVNERTITHKLAEKLARHFGDLDVDCEYNRQHNRIEPKRLPPLSYPPTAGTDDTEGLTIFPDIIIHLRATEENLLVIEAKKSSNRNKDSTARDHQKIMGLCGPTFGYRFGLRVSISTGELDKPLDRLEATGQ